MALPVSLRTSVIPQELELVACEQLVEIIPLVAMERTAFISCRERMDHCVPQLNAKFRYGWLLILKQRRNVI